MSKRQSWLRWPLLLLRWLWIAVASLCIVAALLVGVLRLLMPLAPEFTQQMAQRLSVATGREIRIDHISCDWVQGGPTCQLRDVRISGAPGSDGIVLPRAELALNVFLWAFTDQRLLEMRVADADLQLSRDENGRWGAQALGVQWPDNPQSQTDLPLLLRGARFTIVDSILRVQDSKRDRSLNLYVSSVSMMQRGSGVHVSGRLAPLAQQNANLEFAFDSSTPSRASQGLPYELYVQAREFPLSALSDVPAVFGFQKLAGELNMQLWAEVRDGQLQHLHGNATASSIRIEGADLELEKAGAVIPVFGANSLAADFQWQRESNRWRMAIPRLRIERENSVLDSNATIVHLDNDAQAPDQLLLKNFRGEDIAALLLTSNEVPNGLRQALYQLAPFGLIETLELKAATDDPLDPVAHLRIVGSQMSWSDYSGVPGISGASLDILHQGQRGEAAIHVQQGSVSAPGVLPTRLFIDTAVVDSRWQFDEEFTLDIPQARVLGNGYNFQLGGNLKWQTFSQLPLVDLQLRAQALELQQLQRFFPDQLPDGARRWLAQAFRAGQLSRADAVFRADLNDPDFSAGKARFQATGEIVDLAMHYQRAWPDFIGDAQFRFDNLAFTATGSGSVQNMRVLEARAHMPDMRVPEMLVEAKGAGDGMAPMELVRVSPVGNALSADLAVVNVSGEVQADLTLRIPLKKNSPWKTEVDGKLRIVDNLVEMPDLGLRFSKVTGEAAFDRYGLTANQLQGEFSERSVALGIAIGESVSDPDMRLLASMSGNIPATQFAALYPPIKNLAERIEGVARWDVTLGLGADDKPGLLNLQSDLIGTRIYLPQPLGKAAESTLPFSLRTAFPLNSTPIQLKLGATTRASVRAFEDGLGANVYFDAGGPPAPQQPGIVLQGQVQTLDWSDWLEDLPALFPPGSEQGVSLNHADLQVAALNAFGRGFQDLHLVLKRSDAEYQVTLDSEHSRGTLTVPVDLGAEDTITGQFESLYWPDATSDASTSDHPAQMPSLNLYADQMRWGELDLGQLRISTYPSAQGMVIDNFEARSEALHLKGSGRWIRTSEGDYSAFSARMTAEDGGVLLRTLGFDSYLVGGQTIAELDVRWPGTLAAMDITRMQGNVLLEVGQGKIPNLDTGAGRLIGLISLQALPRRLSLDFRDIFDTGLVFDRINGSLSLRSGDIYSDDLALIGPTADVLLAGRIGLHAREYELLAKVRPKVGGALSIVGAIAGGGVGAAAMMLFGNALNDPISKASEIQYWVTGGFDEPVIAPAQGVVPPRADALPPPPIQTDDL